MTEPEIEPISTDPWVAGHMAELDMRLDEVLDKWKVQTDEIFAQLDDQAAKNQKTIEDFCARPFKRPLIGDIVEEPKLITETNRYSEGLRIIDIRKVDNDELAINTVAEAARQIEGKPLNRAIRVEHTEKDYRDEFMLINDPSSPIDRKRRHSEVPGDAEDIPGSEHRAKYLLIRQATKEDEELYGIERGTICCDARTEAWGKLGDNPLTSFQALIPVADIENGITELEVRHTYPRAIRQFWDTGKLPEEYRWIQEALGAKDKIVARSPDQAQKVLEVAKKILVEHPEGERDMKHEREVANMLFFVLANGVDENGNRHMSHWFRSTETYEREYVWPAKNAETGTHHSKPVPSDIQGMRTYSYIGLGKDLGYKGTDLENEWFVYYSASGLSCDMPLRHITEAVDDKPFEREVTTNKGYTYTQRLGHLLEGPTNRGNDRYHGWIKDGKEVLKDPVTTSGSL